MARQPKRYEWGGVVCDGDRSRANVHSWFSAFVPADWGLPLAAEVQVDIDTDREKQMRALYRLPDGRLKEAVRRMNAYNTVFVTRPASPSFLAGHSARNALAQLAAALAKPRSEKA